MPVRRIVLVLAPTRYFTISIVRADVAGQDADPGIGGD